MTLPLEYVRHLCKLSAKSDIQQGEKLWRITVVSMRTKRAKPFEGVKEDVSD